MNRYLTNKILRKWRKRNKLQRLRHLHLGEMGKEEQITDIQAFTKEIGKNEQNETKKENHKISSTISMQRGYSEHKDLTIVEWRE